MVSSPPPTTNTQINPPGTTLDTHTSLPSLVPPITLSAPITPINPLALTQHAGTSSQTPFNINLPLESPLAG